jgi:hypothetical protein
VTNLLPLQWEEAVGNTPGALSAGNDMPEPEVRFRAPPVAYLCWTAEEQVGWLHGGEKGTEPFDVLDGTNQACPRQEGKGFRWPGTRPREVQIRWATGVQKHLAWVPVLDEFGRLAATVLPNLDIEDAWGQLANFPMPPDEEEIVPDGDGEPPDGPGQNVSGATGSALYPIRQMMQLVENIAAKQTAVNRADWAMWCMRMEQCLTQAAASPVLREFLTLNLNPVSPLWNSSFRPDYALSGETPEGLRYEEALRRVEDAWKVSALRRIGDLS